MDEQPELRRRRPKQADDDAAYAEFQQTHRSLSDRVERLLMQLVILGLVALVLFQGLMVNPMIRRALNLLEGADGVALNQEPVWQEMLRSQAAADDGDPIAIPATTAATAHSITVMSMTRRSVPEARLLVGGRVAGTFVDGRVTAAVEPGQTVAVDCTRVAQSLKFRVVSSQGLASPALGAEVTTRGDKKSLGVVRLDD